MSGYIGPENESGRQSKQPSDKVEVKAGQCKKSQSRETQG